MQATARVVLTPRATDLSNSRECLRRKNFY